MLGSLGPLAGTDHDEVLTPGCAIEHFLCTVEEQRPFLRCDHRHFEPALLGDASEGIVRAKRLPVHHRVGHDHDGAPVAGQEAAYFAQTRAHFLRPERAGFVVAQTPVAAARADLLLL